MKKYVYPPQLIPGREYQQNRLQQTIDTVTTNSTLDLNTGLTQVLSDGTTTYLYGNGRVAEYESDWAYYLPDALGSVRQLTNPTGALTLLQSYQPYVEVLNTEGDVGGGVQLFFSDNALENVIISSSADKLSLCFLPIVPYNPYTTNIIPEFDNICDYFEIGLWNINIQ
jgi:hypothetical protein